MGLGVNHSRSSFPSSSSVHPSTRPTEDLQTQRGPTRRMQTWSCFAAIQWLAMATTNPHICSRCKIPAELVPRTPLGLALWKTMETATLRSPGSGASVTIFVFKRMPSVFSRECSGHTYSEANVIACEIHVKFYCPL